MADDTREECMRLFDSREYYFIWFGACRLTLSLLDLIENIKGDKKLNNTKFIKNTLDFLIKSKSDMLTYILNSSLDGALFKVAPVRDNKGKATKEYKPYKLIYSDMTTPEICGTEFISEEEHKWRDTARILMDAVSAADVAPVVHGRWVYGCQCSVCGDRHGPYNSRHRPYYNYCPNCGAKMDEEE